VRIRRLALVLTLAGTVTASCTGSTPAVSPLPSSSSTAVTGGLSVVPARSDPLCKAVPVHRPRNVGPAGSLPSVFARVAQQVEQIRSLTYLRPVRAQAVTRAAMNQLMHDKAGSQEPRQSAARTSKAWATIGVIPRGTDLYKAVSDFDASQVLGFYDPETRRLVFIGTNSPGPFQRFTLSHELTHALDDQHFDLTHLDRLQSCRDDEQGAYISLAEGDAVVTSVLWARQDLSAQELTQVEQAAGSGPPPPASVPPFLVKLMEFPYEAGPAFIETLLQQGGPGAIDDAFRHPPVSTEQVLHPERYPSDRPVTVEVPNAASKLGRRWKEIEIEQVGEEWLQLLFGLHLSSVNAAADSDHWGGGQYRAWSDGAHTAVVMDTAWDSHQASARFAQGMRQWLGNRSTATVLQVGPALVRVLFASDRQTITLLRRIMG